jgi:outer membrane protein OmpA-like peptidoglycan-associated protein
MRILYTLLSITIVSSLGWTQSYKADYARKLSKELQFVDALPIWEELSTAFISKKKKGKQIGDYSFLRMTVQAATLSEGYVKALYWSQQLVNKKQANEQDWINMIELICLNKKYIRLSNVVDSASVSFPNSMEIKSWKNNLSLINSRINSNSDYTLSLYKKANKGEDYAAFPYKKGILFTSNEYDHGFINRTYNRTNQNFTDIAFYDPNASTEKAKFYQKAFWIDLFYKNQWRDIKRTKSHDGPISFNQDYTMAFITSNEQQTDEEDRVKFSKLKLRVFKLEGSNWNEIAFPFNSSNFSNGHASMDTLGNIYFASDRPGSMPKNFVYADSSKLKIIDTIYSSDIYKTSYIDGEWTEPVNLGATINTNNEELFPFISSKGILYFSSNGWPGMGGLDIFSSELANTAPEHIGNPVNSNADDFAYYVNETSGKGFISSNRVDWIDQIYAFTKPVFKAELVAQLKTCKGAPMKNKTVQIVDLTKNIASAIKTDAQGRTEEPYNLEKGRKYKIYYVGDDVNKADSTFFTASADGEFEVKLTSYYKKNVTKLVAQNEKGLPLENVMMNLYKHDGTVLKYLTPANGSYSWRNEGTNLIDSVKMNLINHDDGRLSIPVKFDGNCIDTVALPVVMTTNSGDDFIRLDLILYNLDKYSLRPESKVELDKLVKYMMSHSELMVELSSHTDSRASTKYNNTLSENRSKSCVKYIISKGIPKERIIAKGYGESKLVNKCMDKVRCSEAEHQANRRTELKLLDSSNQELNNNKLGN